MSQVGLLYIPSQKSRNADCRVTQEVKESQFSRSDNCKGKDLRPFAFI